MTPKHNVQETFHKFLIRCKIVQSGLCTIRKHQITSRLQLLRLNPRLYPTQLRSATYVFHSIPPPQSLVISSSTPRALVCSLITYVHLFSGLSFLRFSSTQLFYLFFRLSCCYSFSFNIPKPVSIYSLSFSRLLLVNSHS